MAIFSDVVLVTRKKAAWRVAMVVFSLELPGQQHAWARETDLPSLDLPFLTQQGAQKPLVQGPLVQEPLVQVSEQAVYPPIPCFGALHWSASKIASV